MISMVTLKIYSTVLLKVILSVLVPFFSGVKLNLYLLYSFILRSFEFEISEKLRGKFEASLSHIHINKEKEVKFHCETEAAFVNLSLHNYRLEGTMQGL